MPNKNTERHKSSKGTLLAIFEKRKVRGKRKGGEERRRTRQEEGRGGGSLFILLLCRHPVSL